MKANLDRLVEQTIRQRHDDAITELARCDHVMSEATRRMADAQEAHHFAQLAIMEHDANAREFWGLQQANPSLWEFMQIVTPGSLLSRMRRPFRSFILEH